MKKKNPPKRKKKAKIKAKGTQRPAENEQVKVTRGTINPKTKRKKKENTDESRQKGEGRSGRKEMERMPSSKAETLLANVRRDQNIVMIVRAFRGENNPNLKRRLIGKKKIREEG